MREIQGKEDDITENTRKILKSHKTRYFMFLLFPDLFEPVRVPRMFPLPSCLSRKTFYRTVSAVEGYCYITWTPRLTYKMSDILILQPEPTTTGDNTNKCYPNSNFT